MSYTIITGHWDQHRQQKIRNTKIAIQKGKYKYVQSSH